ncbi:DNA-binding XRE family transcriptional regulator [Saccharomonospora amisosensis]|uniref:DNA-binding XRE family transcriptional regulator n=1 Tax=Saccharomonospora amisosensis TaxID=1128677 RepID=A0A7X5ZR42_9PSEU|nr:helix-turn-helix domain-containing protein [Saccharomonospora amisosensis]NIJ12146.1 DNA-binding XRE family transcriptional regulator [Saccharomonospora amisosensis]
MDAAELADLVVTTTDRNPLVGLGAVARVRTEMERAEAALVRRARNAGATWEDIAAALGVSKQAVHKKYRGNRLLGGRS